MNWMKYRLIYFLISAAVIGTGIFAYLKWGLSLGIDFKGGALIEYKVGKDFSNQLRAEDARMSEFEKSVDNLILK